MSTLRLHRATPGYIGRLSVADEVEPTASAADQQFALVLDRSGSMGRHSDRMVKKIFPPMLRRLGLNDSDRVLLITFDSDTVAEWLRVDQLETYDASARGRTYMARTPLRLRGKLNRAQKTVRLLTVSDGKILDFDETHANFQRVVGDLKTNFRIFSKTVRLFTSVETQPDTRALATMMQLNTETAGSIVDLAVQLPDEALVIQMTKLFSDDDSIGRFTLTSTTPTFRRLPWADSTTEYEVDRRISTIWLSSPPTEPTVNGASVTVETGEPLTQETVGRLLEPKIDYFVAHLKVLKVVDTVEAKKEIARIVDYFAALERSLPPPRGSETAA